MGEKLFLLAHLNELNPGGGNIRISSSQQWLLNLLSLQPSLGSITLYFLNEHFNFFVNVLDLFVPSGLITFAKLTSDETRVFNKKSFVLAYKSQILKNEQP